MTIIWCMVPEISSTTDIIFCGYFGLFFALLPRQPRKSKFWKNEKCFWRYYHFRHKYHKNHVMYDFWDMECNRQSSSHFGTFFFPFTPLPPLIQKIKILKKWRKKNQNLTDFIILHKLTKNYNHIIYGSWDMNCNRQIFFVILGHFLPFYPPPLPPPPVTAWKMKKKPGDISFYRSVPKLVIIGYILFLRYGAWRM